MKREGRDRNTTAILHAAGQLFKEKGYDATSVDDILAVAELSKGTFYHYFKSKRQLLDVIVQNINNRFIEELAPIVRHPDLNAVEKLNSYFQINQSFKSTRRQMMIVLMRSLYRRENAQFRQALQERTRSSIAPLLAGILSQGVEEGMFTAEDPYETALMLLGLGMQLRDRIVAELQAGNPDYDAIMHKVRVFERTVERILAAPAGSLHMMEEDFFRQFATGLRDQTTPLTTNRATEHETH